MMYLLQELVAGRMEKYSPSRRDLTPHHIFTQPIIFTTGYRKRKGVDFCCLWGSAGVERVGGLKEIQNSGLEWNDLRRMDESFTFV